MATHPSQPPLDAAARSDLQEAISLPLYLSALAVCLAGLFAVNAELGDPQFATTTVTLTVIGFVFSFFCRWWRIRVRVLEILGLCCLAYFGFRYLTHSFSLEAFMPSDVQQGDLIMAVVLVWLTVVRAWVLTSDESLVFTCVVSIAMIGLVGAYNVNTELLVYFALYVISATFLLLHQNYLVYRSWSARAADGKTDDLALRVQIGLALASALAVFLIGAVFMIPYHAATAHLSLGNALRNLVAVEQKTPDQPEESGDGTQIELSDDKTLKVGTGEGFSASDTVVLRAYPSDHQEHYWRGRTYDSYQGNSWASTIGDQQIPLNPAADRQDDANDVFAVLPHQQIGAGLANSAAMNRPDGRPTLLTKVEVASGRTSTLYLPYDTLRILIPRSNKVASLTQSRDLDFDLPGEVTDGFTYSAISLVSDATPAALRHDPPSAANFPPQIRRYYRDQIGQQIVAPADQARLDRVVRRIVSGLPAGRRTDYDVAEAIRAYVSQQATYSLAVSAVPDDQDAVSYFLFTSRRGYCDLFASSMAVLCRHAGLASRVATGFAPGIRNTQDGFDLRGLDKHAWVEVWFPHDGWVEFDPTVGSRADASITSGSGPLNQLRKWMATLSNLLNLEGPFPYVILALIIAGLAYLVKVEVIDRITNRRAGSDAGQEHRSLSAALKVSSEAAMAWSRGAARARYARMEDLLDGVGWERPGAATPLEYQRSLMARMERLPSLPAPVSEGIAQAVTVLTEDVMLAAYAPIDLSGPVSLQREQEGIGAKALQSLEQQIPLLKRAVRQQEKAVVRSETT